MKNGARHAIACEDLGINVKTFNRWQNDIIDKRNGPLSAPANKLTEDEVAEIIKISTSRKYMDLSPCQIVPSLADRGKYIASESSFYKILKKQNLLSHRGKVNRGTITGQHLW